MRTRSSFDRRDFLRLSAAAAAAASLPVQARAQGQETSTAAFALLPLGDIKPSGWLHRQLRIQADGLSGHLDEFWPDVGPNSGWLGGTGESWERGPYFVDGILPLAFQLDDDKLKAKALAFVNWTLDNQQPSGMIGPPSNDDWWPRMVMVKVLAQYHDATQDPRVLPVLTKYFHYQLAQLPGRPLVEWGKFRWQDEVFIVEWLHQRTHDPKLLELAALLQQQGFDWQADFTPFTDTEPTARNVIGKNAPPELRTRAMRTHGVNNGQALKTAPVVYLLTGSSAERGNYNHQLAMLDQYHGVPNGMFTCDEHFGGLEPAHGTELCTVVETMFSMEVALSVFGDAPIGDRIEKIAYNALPGTFTDDMWAHQYNQQSNQIQVGLLSKPWTTDGPESNLYGLAPNFGCCTANYHQGWPKFTGSLWMRSADGGLAAALYAPCEVRTKVAGQSVHIAQQTEYPFRDSVRITVTPDAPASFPLHLRIPGWTKNPTLSINGRAESLDLTPGTFVRIARTWKAGDVLELRFPMTPTISRSSLGAVSVSRGPIVFSLEPGANFVKLRDQGPTADWQVFPTAAWNYALHTDQDGSHDFKVIERPIGARPFSREGAGVFIQMTGRRIDSWRSRDGVADNVPKAPASDNPEELLTLIPYGAAKLRITAFPELVS